MHVVGVGNHEVLIGLAAAQRHREQQIVVVHPAVAVAVEGRKVLDELDPPVSKDAEIELGADALNLTADLELMGAALPATAPRTSCQRVCVVPCGTRKDEPPSRLGNVSCTPGCTGAMRVVEIAEADAEASLSARGDSTPRPRSENRVQAVSGLLALRRRANRSIERAGRDVVFALAGISAR